MEELNFCSSSSVAFIKPRHLNAFQQECFDTLEEAMGKALFISSSWKGVIPDAFLVGDNHLHVNSPPYVGIYLDRDGVHAALKRAEEALKPLLQKHKEGVKTAALEFEEMCKKWGAIKGNLAYSLEPDTYEQFETALEKTRRELKTNSERSLS